MKSDLIDQQYGDGFTSMSIVYAVFALSNFTAPAVVKLFGHKATMVSCFLCSLRFGTILFEKKISLDIESGIII